MVNDNDTWFGCIAALFGLAAVVGIIFVLARAVDQPASITDKYQCRQQVNGQQQQAYCLADSNGTSYYVPYYYWRSARIGTGDNYKYMRTTVPSEEIPPAERSVISEHVSEHGSGGEHGGFGGEGGGHGGGGR